MSAKWRSSLRDYKKHVGDVDKELEELLDNEDSLKGRKQTATHNDSFTDLNLARKQFRDAVRKISALGKGKPKDFFTSRATDESSSSDEELPLRDNVKPITFKEDSEGESRYRPKKDEIIFDTTEEKRDWFQSVLKTGHSLNINKDLERLQEDEDEEENNILKELEKEWQRERKRIIDEDSVDAIELREKLDNGTLDEETFERIKKTYIDCSGSESDENGRKYKKE